MEGSVRGARTDTAVKRRRIAILAVAFALGSVFALSARGICARELNLTPLPKGERRSVRIGVGGTASSTHLVIWIAKYGGHFDRLKEKRIDVEVIPFGGGSSALLALAGGQVDFTYQFAEHAIKAKSQGRDVMFIFAALPVPALGVTVRMELKDKIKSVKDIEGYRWGFTSFGSGSHVVSLRVAKRYGVDPARVSWTPVGGTKGYLPSMREKRVDVLTSGIQFSDALVRDHTAYMLVDLTDSDTVKEIYGYPYISAGLLTTKKYLTDNPYITYSIVDVLTVVTGYLKKTPPAEIARALPAEFQSPGLEGSVSRLAKAHSDTGYIDLPAIDHLIQDMVDLKLIPAVTFTAKDIVDSRFVEAVQKRK